MKNKQLRCDLARIKSVIEGDRRNVSCDVEKMLIYDLTCVLGGYFEVSSRPQIEITSAHGNVRVSITLLARSVKSAGVKPCDV